MRRAFTIIVALAAFALTVAYLNGGAHTKPQAPILTKDGSADTDSIPDYVAYEFFFKSLINSPAEGVKGQKRVEAFALQTGLEKGEADILLADAQRFYQEVSALDRRIKTIKDQTWPDPPAQVWKQLKDIQKQKEATIIQQVEALFAARSPKMTSQLRDFVKIQVKSKIKGFADQPNPGQKRRPHHTIVGFNFASFLGLLPFTASAQMQGDETVYIYANSTYSAGSPYVYGYGDVQATASSYGHEYSARTEMYGPCGQFESGTGSNVGELFYNGSWCDGTFSFYCIAVQACPIANNFFDAGSNEDTEFVAPFVTLSPFGNWNPDTIVAAGDSNIAISVNSSTGVPSGTTVTLNFGETVSNGTAQFSKTPATAGDAFAFTIGPSDEKTITAKYDPSNVTGTPDVRAICSLTVPTGTGITALQSPQTSTSILRIR